MDLSCSWDSPKFAAKVEVTPLHYMMVLGKGTIEAREVAVGDWMHILSDGNFLQAKVTSITPLSKSKMVRLVLTESGSIVVNSVLASSVESSGSSIVDSMLKAGSVLAGEVGQEIVRTVTYQLGRAVTGGDAESVV